MTNMNEPDLLAALQQIVEIAADPAAAENADAVEVTLARVCEKARAAIAALTVE